MHSYLPIWVMILILIYDIIVLGMLCLQQQGSSTTTTTHHYCHRRQLQLSIWRDGYDCCIADDD